jgi:hypothetical protein
MAITEHCRINEVSKAMFSYPHPHCVITWPCGRLCAFIHTTFDVEMPLWRHADVNEVNRTTVQLAHQRLQALYTVLRIPLQEQSQ